MAKVRRRFWSNVAAARKEDCWLWVGSLSTKGYGNFTIQCKYWSSHRVAWELVNGPIPDGLCVLHRCDNPRCVNPAHLFLGTQLENIRDRDRKGRQVAMRGEKHGGAKLTTAQVREIRNRSTGRRGEQVQFAREFGVDQTLISLIIKNRIWVDA